MYSLPSITPAPCVCAICAAALFYQKTTPPSVWFISEFTFKSRGANKMAYQPIIRDTLKNQQYPGWKRFEGLEDAPEFEVWLGDEVMMEQQWAKEDNVYHFWVGSNVWSLKHNKYDTLVIWGMTRTAKSSNAFQNVEGSMLIHRRGGGSAQCKYDFGSNWPKKIVFAFQYCSIVPWDPKHKPCRSWRGKEPSLIRYQPYKIREFITAFQQGLEEHNCATKAVQAAETADRKRRCAEAAEERAKQRKLDKQEAMKILKD